ncbi:Uncharacterised protein [Candidatus Tiddalikarchaeum anstoanum]|nr:Uncharacterised protein [Candidatus Tiddalikarchaeum anstoanum]
MEKSVIYAVNLEIETPKKISHKIMLDIAEDISSAISKAIPVDAYARTDIASAWYYLQHHYLRKSPTKISEFACVKPEYVKDISLTLDNMLCEIADNIKVKGFLVSNLTQETIPNVEPWQAESKTDKYWGKRIHLPVLNGIPKDVNKFKGVLVAGCVYAAYMIYLALQ